MTPEQFIAETTIHRPDGYTLESDFNVENDKQREIGEDVHSQNARLSRHYLRNNTFSRGDKQNLIEFTVSSKALTYGLLSPNPMSASMSEHHKNMMQALSNLPAAPETIHTYSGISNKLAEHYDTVHPNDTMHNKTYISTSIAPSVSMNFGTMHHWAHFVIPSGEHHGGYVEPWTANPREFEYIIKPETTWRLQKKTSFYRYGQPKMLYSFAPQTYINPDRLGKKF